MASDLTPEDIASLRAEALSGSGRQRRPRRDLWLRLLDMAERCADYDRRLSEVMPKDFKDWHQNSRREWPEVAAGTIANLRERLASCEGERDCLESQCDYYKADLDAIRAVVPNVEGVATQDLVREQMEKAAGKEADWCEANEMMDDDGVIEGSFAGRVSHLIQTVHFLRDRIDDLKDDLRERALDDKEQRT